MFPISSYEYSEKNTCVNYQNGFCMKIHEACPSHIRYNDDNSNNTPCDLAGYEPATNRKDTD